MICGTWQKCALHFPIYHYYLMEKQRAGSAVSIVQNGLFGKACQVLVYPGVVPYCYETLRLLVAKHPECAVPIVSPCYPT